MSEERFDRIESTLEVLAYDVKDLRTDVNELKVDVNELKVDVNELKVDVSQLKVDVSQLKVDVSQLKVDVNELKADVKELRTDVTELKSGQARMEVRQDRFDAGLTDLRHYMGVIHEDLIDRIQASAVPVELLRREFRDGLEELRADTDQRLRPLEVVVAEHSKDIASLKRRRG